MNGGVNKIAMAFWSTLWQQFRAGWFADTINGQFPSDMTNPVYNGPNHRSQGHGAKIRAKVRAADKPAPCQLGDKYPSCFTRLYCPHQPRVSEVYTCRKWSILAFVD